MSHDNLMRDEKGMGEKRGSQGTSAGAQLASSIGMVAPRDPTRAPQSDGPSAFFIDKRTLLHVDEQSSILRASPSRSR
jgi:hypothetical protein